MSKKTKKAAKVAKTPKAAKAATTRKAATPADGKPLSGLDAAA